jgi:hypothetical protein
MKLKQTFFKKTYEVSRTGVIVVYPSLQQTPGGGGISHILRILRRLKKGR